VTQRWVVIDRGSMGLRFLKGLDVLMFSVITSSSPILKSNDTQRLDETMEVLHW